MESVRELLGSIPQPVQWLCAGVGALFLGGKIFSFVHLLLDLFVLTGTNLRKYGGKDSWVVITGASDGLGKEFAQLLAAKGWNLVLVSRTQSKLDALAKELEEKYASSNVQVKTLALDYSKSDDADFDRLAELVKPLDVAILLNNVGMSHSFPEPFLLTERKRVQDIVTINILGTLKTTQVVAPILQQRKKGLILTLGSQSGWTPTPYLATYSGSKGFLQNWSTALAYELKGSGVDVQVVLAYMITGAMAKVRRASVMIPNPKPWARATLNSIGLGGTQHVANTLTPWWSHALLLWFVENTVGAGSPITIKVNGDAHLDIRKRALRKQAREAKKQ